jgi:hypothetical protein
MNAAAARDSRGIEAEADELIDKLGVAASSLRVDANIKPVPRRSRGIGDV